MVIRSSSLHLLALAVLATACGGASLTVGPRAEEQYRSPEYPYEVQPAPESPRALLGPEWKAQSLRLGTGSFGGATTAKTSTVEQHYDWNQDGRSDTRESLPRYELRLVHDTGAEVFIRAVPVPPSLQGRSLGGLAQAYLDAVMREGDMAARFSPADLPTESDARFEVGVLDEASCRVSGIEAYRLEISARRTQPEEGDTRRARLVIVRPGYRHKVNGDSDHEVPVMLVAAYVHEPEAFDTLEPDFSRFLGQWVLGGYGEAIPTEHLGHTCQP